MRNNKSLMTIFLIVFIDLLGFGIILPLLPYIAEKYQATPAQIGILTATYSFFQLIASPIFGRLSDRYGRKKLLIISQLGSAVGYLILGLAGNLPLDRSSFRTRIYFWSGYRRRPVKNFLFDPSLFRYSSFFDYCFNYNLLLKRNRQRRQS